jgi:predicted RND superfamily exporter protein
MGWLGVPLDIATVMVSSIALGLVVDDTLHTLGHFRQLAPEMGHEAALGHIFEAAAPVYCLNALVLVAGFGVCSLSSFGPVSRFGGVCAATIVIALIGDIVVFGALLAAAPEGAWERLLGKRAAGGELPAGGA